MRFGLLVPVLLGGCGFLFSGFDEYCEERADCIDANDEDEKACAVDIQNTRRIARVYGCEDDYMDYMECMKEEAECASQGRYDYWTDRGECEDDLDDWLDCLADESDVIGGSSSDWDDTGSWGWEEEEEEEVEVDEEQSCWFSDVVCIETSNPYPEDWCYTEGGDPYYDSCDSGWDGMCEIPSYGSGTWEYGGTVYYYGMDGSDACTDVGGTFSAG